MSIFEIRSFLGLAGYYERHENGLKLSIRDRIVGLRLRDIDSMVGTVLTIEREIEDTWNTRETGVGSKREDQLSPSSGRGKRLLLHTSFRTRARIEHEGRDCPKDRDPKTLGQCSPS